MALIKINQSPPAAASSSVGFWISYGGVNQECNKFMHAYHGAKVF